jgi:hypothetical protein
MVLPYLKGFVYIRVLSVLVNGLVFIIGLLLKYICRLFRILTEQYSPSLYYLLLTYYGEP